MTLRVQIRCAVQLVKSVDHELAEELLMWSENFVKSSLYCHVSLLTTESGKHDKQGQYL